MAEEQERALWPEFERAAALITNVLARVGHPEFDPEHQDQRDGLQRDGVRLMAHIVQAVLSTPKEHLQYLQRQREREQKDCPPPEGDEKQWLGQILDALNEGRTSAVQPDQASEEIRRLKRTLADYIGVPSE